MDPNQKIIESQQKQNQNQNYFKKVEKYILINKVGEGQFGQVYRSKNQETGEVYAIKIVASQMLQKNQKLNNFVQNEVKILTQVNNEYVVKLHDVLRTSNNLYFVYELCEGGTLEDLLKKHQRLTEEHAHSIIKQILTGFVSLIQINILHRDMKPGNIFFKSNMVKIGDFGFCKQLENRQDLAQTQLGSPLYMAPEILFGNSYDNKADIWSIGVIFYELLYGICPFETNNIVQLIQKINEGTILFPSNVNVSHKTINLIQRMLVKDPLFRVDWMQLFNEFNINVSDYLNKSNKFSLKYAQIQIWHKLSHNNYLDVFQFMIKMKNINSIKDYQQFICEQRNKLNFMLEIFKSSLAINLIDLQYKIDLIKVIKIFQEVVESIQQLEFNNMNLNQNLINQIRTDLKINNFIQQAQVENNNIKQLCISYLQKNGQQFRNYEYQYFDFIKFTQDTLQFANLVFMQHQNDIQKVVQANLMIDVVLLEEIFNTDEQDYFEYTKYFNDLKKLSLEQIVQVLDHKRQYLAKIKV